MNNFVIIRDGKIDFNNMIDNNIDINLLIKYLRKKRIKNIENIEILISFYNKIYFVKNKLEPVSLIMNGRILYMNLFRIKKNITWIKKSLLKHNTSLNKILYAVYLNKKLYIITNVN